jgi:hypothetical protein
MGDRRRLLVGVSAWVAFCACNLRQARLDQIWDEGQACRKNDRGACAALAAECGDGRHATNDPQDPIASACGTVIALEPDDDVPADAKRAFYATINLEGAATYATAHCDDNNSSFCFAMSEMGTRLADVGDPRGLDLLQRACNFAMPTACLAIAERDLKAPPPMSGPFEPAVAAVLDLRQHSADSIESLTSEVGKLEKRLAGMDKASPETPAVVRRLAERASDLAWSAERAGTYAPAGLWWKAHAQSMASYDRLASQYPAWCASPATANAPAHGCIDESLYYAGFEAGKIGRGDLLIEAYEQLARGWPGKAFFGPACVGRANQILGAPGLERGKALSLALEYYETAMRFPPATNSAWGAAHYGYARVMAEKGNLPQALNSLHKAAELAKADPDRNGFAGAVLRATIAVYARAGDPWQAEAFFAPITASPAELKEVLERQYHARLESRRAAVEGCGISDKNVDWYHDRCAGALLAGQYCSSLDAIAKSCRLTAQGASGGEAAKLLARADSIEKRREEADADRKEAREEAREERAARRAQEAEEDDRREAMLRTVAQTAQAAQQSQLQSQENIARIVRQSDEASAQRRRAAPQASAERGAQEAEQRQLEQRRQADQQRETLERARQAQEAQERELAKRRAHEAALAACPRITVAYNLFSHMKMSFDQDGRLVADHSKANGWHKTSREISTGIVRPSVQAWANDRESWRPFSQWAQQVERDCPGLTDRCGAEPYGIDPSAARVTCTAYDDDDLCLKKLSDLSSDAARLDAFEQCAAGYVDEYRQAH